MPECEGCRYCGFPQWTSGKPGCQKGEVFIGEGAHTPQESANTSNRPDGGQGPESGLTDSLMAVRRWDLLSIIPLVAIVALVALVTALVWGVARGDAERARTKLATDALWVEQTLRFQLAVDEDTLVRLVLDAASGTAPDILQARARLHIASNPETNSVQWFDQTGALIASVPEGMDPPGSEQIAALLQSSAKTARPVYGIANEGAALMALRRSGEDGGLIVATISLPMILDRHIPWWIAEQYAVRISDASGTLADRARRPVADGAPSHSISFDPPLSGTVLQITAYDRTAALGNAALMGAIIALSAFSVLALLVVQRSAQHRRRAEERLRAEMAFRRSMEESLTVGLRAKDHEGRILYVNAAFCKLVGLSARALIGQMPPMPYWPADAVEETLARQRALAAGGAVPQAFETRFMRNNGTEINVQVFEAPLIDAQGTHRGWMGSVIDITEAKETARLARAQDESIARTGRLVTLGEMASSLAHELNQPLSAIASYAAGSLNLMAQAQPDLALLRQAQEKLQVQTRRAGQIIRGIQDLVKKREPSFSQVQLAEVVQNTLAFLAADARERHVQLDASLAEVPPLLADPILLEQVLINLVRNGMEAMSANHQRGATLTVSLASGEDGTAVIEIADQGPGIAAEVRDRLFDPFTSTKAEGMGMGLNICRSIIELHRGRLGHRPGPTGGTIFSVILPVRKPDTSARAAE